MKPPDSHFLSAGREQERCGIARAFRTASSKTTSFRHRLGERREFVRRSQGSRRTNFVRE